METIAQASPARAARQVMCSMCWAPPGTHCQQHPAGSHLARYQDAERRGVLARQDLTGVIAGLEVIAGHVIVPDGAR
jgi:hypothetical protein